MGWRVWLAFALILYLIFISIKLMTSRPPKYSAEKPRAGFEPAALWLLVIRSTPELSRPFFVDNKIRLWAISKQWPAQSKKQKKSPPPQNISWNNRLPSKYPYTEIPKHRQSRHFVMLQIKMSLNEFIYLLKTNSLASPLRQIIHFKLFHITDPQPLRDHRNYLRWCQFLNHSRHSNSLVPSHRNRTSAEGARFSSHSSGSFNPQIKTPFIINSYNTQNQGSFFLRKLPARIDVYERK